MVASLRGDNKADTRICDNKVDIRIWPKACNIRYSSICQGYAFCPGSPPLDVGEVSGTNSLAGESPEPELHCEV